MMILDVNNVSKNFGYGQLFRNVSFTLNEGESISIVGPNGCGKSTLLKIIAKQENPNEGMINIKKGAKVIYLDQVGASINDDRFVQDILKEAFGDLVAMENKLTKLQSIINTNTSECKDEKILTKYCDLIEKFTMAGGYEIDTKMEIVLEGLKINKELLNQKYNDLSGGEKTLIQLARVLLFKPELLLLDEPTNHLDINRIEWLENYIKQFKGAIIIVSHDRYFLDKVSNKILAFDNGVAKIFNTNYTGYIKEREHDYQKQLAEFKEQQSAIKRIEEQIKYFAEKGMASNSSTLCDRAHTLQTQLERMKKNAVARPKEQKKISMEIVKERKTSKQVIVADNFSINTPNGKKIIDNINLTICAGERIALIGANGSGKTSFLKAIINIQELPVCGTIYVGPSIKIGYLPQIINFSNGELQLLDYFVSVTGLNEQKSRQILANFHFFKEDVNKRVKNLSGGEKMRVKLAELLQQKINTLIFDEPTNHIDIFTKEALENVLEKFDGTFIFVSHDRYFINKFADKIIEFKDGKINTYCGNYDYYKMEKQKK